MANSTRSGFAAILFIALVAATTPRAQQFTKGTYTGKMPDASAAAITLSFADDAKMTVRIQGQVMVEAKYVVKGDRIEVNDQSGPIACAPDQTGVYAWKLDAKKLTLTTVKDPCGARTSALTSQPWTLQ
jgi:uncharacterized protein YdeI (BOF family)